MIKTKPRPKIIEISSAANRISGERFESAGKTRTGTDSAGTVQFRAVIHQLPFPGSAKPKPKPSKDHAEKLIHQGLKELEKGNSATAFKTFDSALFEYDFAEGKAILTHSPLVWLVSELMQKGEVGYLSSRAKSLSDRGQHSAANYILRKLFGQNKSDITRHLLEKNTAVLEATGNLVDIYISYRLLGMKEKAAELLGRIRTRATNLAAEGRRVLVRFHVSKSKKELERAISLLDLAVRYFDEVNDKKLVEENEELARKLRRQLFELK